MSTSSTLVATRLAALISNSNAIQNNSSQGLKEVAKNIRDEIEILCAVHAILSQEIRNREEEEE